MGSSRRILASSLLLGAALIAGAAPPARAQTLQGHVVEQGTLAPISGAVVSLLNETLDRRASALTDSEGIFQFGSLPPGRYTLQAEFEGLHSALSPLVEISAGAQDTALVLTLPSRLVMLANECADLQVPGTSVLVGVLLDASSGVVLPAGLVSLRWRNPGGEEVLLETTTDPAGRYRFCGVPTGVPLSAEMRAFGRSGTEDAFLLPDALLARRDLQLGLVRQAVEVQRRRTATLGAPGTLTGRLLDAESGEPIVGAVVRLSGRLEPRLTDAAGRFHFAGLTPRSYTLHVQHLGYGTQSEALDLPSGADMHVNVRLAARAIEIEGVTAATRSRLEAERRVSATRLDVVSGARLKAMEERGARLLDAIHEGLPGLRVMEAEFQTRDGSTSICVEASRNFVRHAPAGERVCDMVVVYLDGTLVWAPQDLLRGLPLLDVESIRFLPPLEAGARYGNEAREVGVLLIWTRGRGPYIDSRRN